MVLLATHILQIDPNDHGPHLFIRRCRLWAGIDKHARSRVVGIFDISGRLECTCSIHWHLEHVGLGGCVEKANEKQINIQDDGAEAQWLAMSTPYS